MKLQVLGALLSAALSVLASPAQVSDYFSKYEGVKVIRVPTGADLQPLEDLLTSFNLERWTSQLAPNSHADIEVPTEKYDSFISKVSELLSEDQKRVGIITMHENVADSIRKESEGMDTPTVDRLVGLANEAWFNTYHSYADHMQFLRDLVATFPNNARIVTSGTTVNGNTITGVNIYGTGGPGTRPAVVLHGTVHAREWITTMVTEGLAYNLLTNYTTSAEVKGYVDKYDYYIFPVVNPDGFLYTQSNDRLWRKNRSSPPSGSSCYGTDINRNWAHSSWGQSAGASTSPCSETYKGPSAASAPETKGLASFIAGRASATGVKMYIDIHSYSQLFMTPYGYTCSRTPTHATELNSLAAGYASALRAVYGTSYRSGPICPTIYQVSGGGVDYSYDNLGVKYSFTTELRDTGSNGFVLPAAQIRPSVIENWAGFKYLLANMV